MKCQKCGQNEVNFYYSTNVNGEVSETYLCAKCVSVAGYDIMSLLDIGNMFDELIPVPVLGVVRQLQPGKRKTYVCTPVLETACECGSSQALNSENKTDTEMTERRELNMQMRIAIENEEFEKAAEIRDKIKALGV